MMRDVILNYIKQFEYKPAIINNNNLKKYNKFIHAGMGGSQLACDLIKLVLPDLDILSHRNYFLPNISESELNSRLIIVNSYSGNTEETLSALDYAIQKKLAVVAISKGGRLLEIAKANNIPYVELSDMGLEPRMSLGLGFLAILKIIGDDKSFNECVESSKKIIPSELEEHGSVIAKTIRNKIPIIYSSTENEALAKNWKIKLNESGKIPAFWNVLPELNHNEMSSYNADNSVRFLSDNLHFIFLKDDADYPRTKKRFEILENIYTNKGLNVTNVSIQGENKFYKVFRTVILGDWLSFYTAREYNLSPEEIPIVEEFKRLIA